MRASYTLFLCFKTQEEKKRSHTIQKSFKYTRKACNFKHTKHIDKSFCLFFFLIRIIVFFLAIRHMKFTLFMNEIERNKNELQYSTRGF